MSVSLGIGVPPVYLALLLGIIIFALIISCLAALRLSAVVLLTQESLDNNVDPLFVTTDGLLIIDAAVAKSPLAALYQNSSLILPFSWAVVIAALFWRGRVKSIWSKHGYDYETFKLLARTRGSPMRLKLLNTISQCAKNKNELARELEVDWKTVDNHIEILLRNGLVNETEITGAIKYFEISEHGRRVLSLLSEDG